MWTFCGAILAAVALTTFAWGSSWTVLALVGQIGTLLSTLGALICATIIRRGAKDAEEVDFAVGIAGYPLEDLGSRRRAS
jgi:hypothetical protein